MFYVGSQLAALSISSNNKNPASYTLVLVIPIHLKVLPKDSQSFNKAIYNAKLIIESKGEKQAQYPQLAEVLVGGVTFRGKGFQTDTAERCSKT